MKILFYISSMGGGGAQRVLWSLANYFCDNLGHNVFIATDLSSPSAYKFADKVNLVDLENGILRLLNTKGDKQRLVPVTNEMNDILKKYCSIMSRMIDTEWLFPSSKREGPISDRSVKHRFEYILEECNIHLENRSKFERGPCLHCFRHVFAFKSFSLLVVFSLISNSTF